MVIEPRDIAWVIKTADRARVGKRNYLAETIANLRRSSPSWDGCRVHVVSHDDLTLQQNAQRAIARGVETGLPFVCVLEDDLDFCRDFHGSVARWLSDHLDEKYPMYALGANYKQIAQAAALGETAWKYQVKDFYGAQALLWTWEAADDLARWLGPDPDYNGVRDHGHDLLLQQWGKRRRATCFLASAPSFVQHIGEESGIGNRYFGFPWGGREWCYQPWHGGDR